MPKQLPRPDLAMIFHRPGPKPLPRPPTRSLTLSPEADQQRSAASEGCPHTCNQLQSLFFKDFPFELRERVYIDVLGANVCHIWPHGTNLCHQNGKWAPNSGLCCFCGPPILENLQNISELRELGDRSSTTSLLRSCRRVYSEAIDYLYSENTFEILDAVGFMPFCVSVLPHRFNRIRSLRFGHQVTAALLNNDPAVLPSYRPYSLPPHDPSAWGKCWNLIADMENLQELHVTLEMSPAFITWPGVGARPFSREGEKRLLAPLHRVVQPANWQLYVNWPETWSEFEAAPFTKHYPLADKH